MDLENAQALQQKKSEIERSAEAVALQAVSTYPEN
jgi:hypothetical protein